MNALEPLSCDDSQLCRELAGERERVPYYEVYGAQAPTRVLKQTQHFSIICDLDPLTPGHLLIVPKRHYLSFRSVPLELFGELLALKGLTYRALSGVYDYPMLIEHGTGFGKATATCISHAHWHVVPMAADITQVLNNLGLSGTLIDSEAELPALVPRDRSYLYVQAQAGQRVVYTLGTGELPKQFPRKVIAEHLKLRDPEWDWALSLHSGFLSKTLADLKPILSVTNPL